MLFLAKSSLQPLPGGPPLHCRCEEKGEEQPDNRAQVTPKEEGKLGFTVRSTQAPSLSFAQRRAGHQECLVLTHPSHFLAPGPDLLSVPWVSPLPLS